MKYCQICELTYSDNQDLFCEKCGRELVDRPAYEDPLSFKKLKKLGFFSGNWIYAFLFLLIAILFFIILFTSFTSPNILLLYLLMVILLLPFIKILFYDRKSIKKEDLNEKEEYKDLIPFKRFEHLNKYRK